MVFLTSLNSTQSDTKTILTLFVYSEPVRGLYILKRHKNIDFLYIQIYIYIFRIG